MRNVRIKRGAYRREHPQDYNKETHMDSIQQLAQLIVVATPLVTLVALNAALLLAGEEDTLLLPGVRAYPTLELEGAGMAPQASETAAHAPQTPAEEIRLAA
jgi:hypothetical protein